MAVFFEAVPDKDEGALLPKGIVKFQIARTLNRRNILTFSCVVGKADDDRQCAQLIRQTLLSLQRLPDLPSNKAPLTLEDLLNQGLTLKQTLFVSEAVFGKQWGALINGELATRQDRRLPRVVVLQPMELTRHVRLRLLTGQGDLDLASDDELRQAGHDPDRLSFPRLLAIVFDGAVAHSIVLSHFDRKVGGYVYWEPWPKGTFLGQEKNKAGVAARQHSYHPKYFWITEEELGKVLYGVLDKWEALEHDRQLIELLSQPVEQALAKLTRLHDADPENLQTSEARLLGAGQSYLLEVQAKEATSAFQICRTLYPASNEAAIGLADARRLQGDRERATKLYREAMDQLTGDSRLTPLKKARLEKHIQEHLSSPHTGSKPRTGERRAGQR
jgi:hypothetical protein